MKQEKVSSIKDLDTLANITIELLKSIGLVDINRISNEFIQASEKSPLKTRKLFFLLTLSELNGKIVTIKNAINNHIIDIENIYIVTVNKKISNYFKEWLEKNTPNCKNYDYWGESDLIKLIDKHYKDFWSHQDTFIKIYENKFLNELSTEKELKQLLKLDNKYDDLLNIFIEPKIYLFKQDKETQKPVNKKIHVDNLLDKDNYILTGEAGTGKSTLLKEIGKRVIQKNTKLPEKTIPIYIKHNDLVKNNFLLKETIVEKLQENFFQFGIDKVFKNYHILLLIDSIDQFERKKQEQILDDINNLVKEHSINFVICTRNYNNLIKDYKVCTHQKPYLRNFDLKQVKQYLDHFFRFDLAKSDELWQILSENNTLDKMPMTALTISLISILYEDRGYEIPATITDVYNNFNLFLLGKINVNSRLDFLDINIKERLLSSYALEIINSDNRNEKTKDEFGKYITSFFSKRSITIEKETIPDLIKSLTDGTGILYIDETGYISFKHEHFMEYYASIEIFKHYRNTHEETLIKRFNDFNWQNTAIFYAGITKDMPDFLEKLIEHTKSYNSFQDCWLAISGLGYILQSLWMTDSSLRKKGIKEALNLLIKVDMNMKKLAIQFPWFQKLKTTDIAITNLAWFYKHFNSIVLRDPLNLAFSDLYTSMSRSKENIFQNDRNTLLYQLFCIAATLNTGRNLDSKKLELLFNEDNILSNPFFVSLFEIGLEVLEPENKKDLKKRFKLQNRKKKYFKEINRYNQTTIEQLRLTNLDLISPIKKVEIFTEGKTDAVIISHAFSILTNNEEPIWKISSCEVPLKKDSGGANQLARLLTNIANNINTEYDNQKTIIGIFDNDAKGCQEFSGLIKDFELLDNRTKKHKKYNIFALKLPIPHCDSFNSYHQNKQEFRFFELEHYFSIEFLKKNNMIQETPIPNVVEIKNNKTNFSKQIIHNNNPETYKHFPILFQEIDKICNQDINYIEA